MSNPSAEAGTATAPDAPTALFEHDGEKYLPLPVSRSPWKAGRLNGVAITGLLAHSAENTLTTVDAADFVPARFTAIMFRSAADAPSTVRSRVLQASARVVVVESDFCQEDAVLARATTLALKPSATPPGIVWSPDEPAPEAPPAGMNRVVDSPMMPLFASANGWSDDFAQHQNSGRHTVWQQPVHVLRGSEPRAFESLAAMADITNMVTNWGDRGIHHINSDVSLTLARRPVGTRFGVRATDRVESDGIAVCSAEVVDHVGRCGIVTITSVATSTGGLDFAGRGDA